MRNLYRSGDQGSKIEIFIEFWFQAKIVGQIISPLGLESFKAFNFIMTLGRDILDILDTALPYKHIFAIR